MQHTGFYRKKIQTWNLVKKIKKFFSNTTETIAAIIITYIKNRSTKKNQNIETRNWEKRASGTETNHRTTKLTKVRNLPLKNNQAEHKSASKNKETTELYMQWQKPKNDSVESHIIYGREGIVTTKMPQQHYKGASQTYSYLTFITTLCRFNTRV